MDGVSIEEIERTPCSYCGALLTVSFEENGERFRVFCINHRHGSPYTQIANPPVWWTSRREVERTDGEEHSFFRPGRSFMEDDGTIQVRVSLWTGNTHACRYLEIPRDSEKSAVWKWILSHPERFHDVISGHEFEQLTIEYHRIAPACQPC